MRCNLPPDRKKGPLKIKIQYSNKIISIKGRLSLFTSVRLYNSHFDCMHITLLRVDKLKLFVITRLSGNERFLFNRKYIPLCRFFLPSFL